MLAPLQASREQRGGTHTRPEPFCAPAPGQGSERTGRGAAWAAWARGSGWGRRALAQLWSEVPARGLPASGCSEPGTRDAQGCGGGAGTRGASWLLPGSL